MKNLKNRVLASVCAIALVLSVFYVPVNKAVAEDDDVVTKEVYFTYSNAGVFQLGADEDETLLVNASVYAEDLNNDGKVDIDEVLVAAHDLYCKQGVDGYAAAGGYVNKFFNIGAPKYPSIYLNNVQTSGVYEEVDDEDSIYVYFCVNDYPTEEGAPAMDAFSKFDNTEVDVSPNEEFELQLSYATGYDAAYHEVFSPYKDAIIGTINEDGTITNTEIKTDEEGKVALSFEEEGTYLLTATTDATDKIVPNVCVVNVEPLSKEVYFTYSNKGVFQVGADDDQTLLVNASVYAEDLNNDGKVDIDEVLVAAHDLYCEQGADGYNTEPSTWGTKVTKLFNVEGSPSIYKNNVQTSGIAEEVDDEDRIYVYFCVNDWVDSKENPNAPAMDSFSKFDRTGIKVKPNEEFELQLLNATGYDESYNEVFSPHKDAIIGTINEDGTITNTEIKTDEEGKAKISFDKKGRYYVTAITTAADKIVPNVCCVIVKGPSVIEPTSEDATTITTTEATTTTTEVTSAATTSTEVTNAAKATTTTTAKQTTVANEKVDVKNTIVKKLKSSKKKQLTVSFAKISGVDGYQVQYSTSKKFAKKKTKTVKTTKTKITLKKLKSKKKYYVRVRGFVKKNGVMSYGKYSTAKNKKVK